MDSFLTITAALLLVGSLSSTASRQFDTECYTANGEDYRGCQNQTSLLEGKPCLFWNETFQHPYNTLKYPDGEGGLGSHNYCSYSAVAAVFVVFLSMSWRPVPVPSRDYQIWQGPVNTACPRL
nr:kremen protein 1-like [Salvelinus alpinus]